MRLLSLLACLALSRSAAVGAAPSSIELVYSTESCAGEPPKPEWVAELQSRLPEFKAVWEAIGPQMLGAVASLTGKAVDPLPQKVSLSLCSSPSQAIFGVSVNMRYAIRSFTPEPVPLRYKADTVFHELLHDFVSRNTPRASALLAVHDAESRCVRNHLHLLALQKGVLLSLNASEALTQVISIDSQLPSGCYKRAWNIVNESKDTYERYIAELASAF